ncbi:hypothetical protein CAPTEDRAFT_114892, partial [Capitella teleta]
ALQDAESAISLNSKHVKAHLRKGIALFHLERYSEARTAFAEGQNLDGKLVSFSIEKIIRNCYPSQRTSRISLAGHRSEFQYDWYQTEAFVIISIMIKGVQQEDLKVDITERNLRVEVLMASGSNYTLDLDLLHAIDPERSVSKIFSTKVEIKLKKCDGFRWEKLEGDPQLATVKHIPAAVLNADVHKYPTSSHVTKDWDKVVSDIKKDEKDEKLEGDAALNQLFQQIYCDGSEEVRKAMNKSFVQSGGTVLSTNWGEVGNKDIEMKPPDGMEYKKWTQ